MRQVEKMLKQNFGKDRSKLNQSNYRMNKFGAVFSDNCLKIVVTQVNNNFLLL